MTAAAIMSESMPTSAPLGIVWSKSPGHQADVIVCDPGEVALAIETHPGQQVLAEIHSPLTRAIRRDSDLLETLDADPELGAERLEALVAESQSEITAALEAGASGIFYVLEGACPDHTTPMQYGGHFLELDRRLLESAAGADLNVLFCGGQEVYFDFLADLPTHAISWDNTRNDLPIQSARVMTRAKIALDHLEADLFLARSFDEIERLRARRSPQA